MRGYHEALQKLAELSSNRSVTALFEPSASPSPSRRASPRDLNAQALPEVLAWLRRAGYSPQDLARMRHIHVAGTKGKGSVCAFATAMLAKYRTVGTYTSPHLVSPRERIAIDGVPVRQEDFAEAFFEVWDRLTAAARAEGMAAAEAEGAASKPFFFRFMTILAWHIFLKRGVRDVVMEVGIGGEFDDTNVLPGEAVSAAVVTQLGVDHVAMLGDTVEEISWHKAGIFKPGVRAFTLKMDNQPSVMEVLRERAAEKGTELVELDRRRIEEWGGVVGGSLQGDFQKKNQALAVAAVREHLGMQNQQHDGGAMMGILEDIPAKMIEGLREANLRGRCEIVQDAEHEVTWLLDGAHTTDSLAEVAKWAVSSIERDERMILLYNQQERDAAELLAGFLEAVGRASNRADVFCYAVLTRNEIERLEGMGATRDVEVQKRSADRMIHETARCGAPISASILDNLGDAIAEARRVSRSSDGRRQKILVTGSLHLVGGVLQILEPEALL
ncbi:Folylpolyglutamate synthase [Escovopsis weberi]|uniref:Folylpolyglutamate synthase n=1 Tax=Escovopsis weberi TaxID=150374 RepID=A0A0M8N398_ESCWE|nr:Folylpolyglutamate synthase [Escovopsis weberi]